MLLDNANKNTFKSLMKEEFESKSKDQDKLSLESCLLYEDGRAHCIYNDLSAMIIHPNSDCLTYFTKDGKKVRQVVKYAVNNISGVSDKTFNHRVIDKLVMAMKFYNSFGEEPIFNREELL